MTLPNTLQTRISKLDKDETRVLTVFAVLSQPVTQTQVKDVLGQLKWKDAKGRQLINLIARPLKDKLLKTNLLQTVPNRTSLLFCNEDIIEVLARQAAQDGLYEQVMRIGQRIVPYTQLRFSSQHVPEAERLRWLRDALYRGDHNAVLSQLGIETPFQTTSENAVRRLTKICTTPFSHDWFASLPESIQYPVLAAQVPGNGQWFEYLRSRYQQGSLSHPAFARLLVEEQLLRGQLAGVEALLERDVSWQTQALRGWLHFLRGDYSTCIDMFCDALAGKRKETRKRKSHLDGMPGICFILALLQDQGKDHQLLLDKQLPLAKEQAEPYSYRLAYATLNEFRQVLSTNLSFSQCWRLNGATATTSPLDNLLKCLALHWLRETLADTSHLKQLAVDAVKAQDTGQNWYACEAAAVLRQGNYTNSKIKGLEALLKQDHGAAEYVSLLELIRPQPAWERALQALQSVNNAPSKVTPSVAGANTRLVWWIEKDYRGSYALQPREQKRNKNGNWSKGRPVALKRLFETPDEFEHLSEQDLNICRCIRRDFDYGYYGHNDYYLGEEALLAAVDHPHIYWADLPATPVEITRGEPELLVQQNEQHLHLQLVPALDDDDEEMEYQRQNLIVQHDNNHRLRLIAFNHQHHQIANILGAGGLQVPFSAKEKVLESISAIAPLLTVQSDIGGGNTADATTVEPDGRLHIHIQPAGTELKFSCYVQPLAHGPLFRPGEGGATVLTEIEGKRLQSTRDLKAERHAFQTLLARCPALSAHEWDDVDSAEAEWLLEEEQALETLHQLHAFGDQVAMAWPQGSRLQLARETGLEQMRVSVRSERDWFSLEGELHLDNDQVLSLEKLLVLLHNSPGRFVRLGDNQFLTLTQQLRQRLEALHSHANHRRFHPLAAGTLDELTDGMQVSADKPWQEQLERLREAYQQQPAVPSTLQADLRDYQQEGFQWLARLAHWGAGACLADDMGLGKTVQSLALILSRAAQGPSLILAPTSVCMNWLEEAARFAPTLRPLRFGQGDRQAMLDAAGPFDLIVCSYGLLQTETERLCKVEWHTVVADEAQALKNPHTKRAKAALALPGTFKMIATGTPIENHLGELWSLFHFINPGLLGSLESFNQRFAGPIENRRDTAAKQQLKRLVRPFILRRLKSDVLTELPARTEITLRVPLSDEETAFYEALRRQALEKLAESVANPAQQRVKVLAEIMRLRRACCNPRLVMPGCEIPSAKLQAFGEILDELVENRHRALVFSQFVAHLTLLREYLDGRGIRYQYLDGGTPVKQRQAAVQAFQAGEGELFLISLKAGGAGLNLTAADYVVHMDPWWNPAVEDQASDRAHRLGQQRPVTIYRLVAENTIEDKIVDLHHHKRDLADSLLEGSEVSGKLSLDEIVSLMGESGCKI